MRRTIKLFNLKFLKSLNQSQKWSSDLYWSQRVSIPRQTDMIDTTSIITSVQKPCHPFVVVSKTHSHSHTHEVQWNLSHILVKSHEKIGLILKNWSPYYVTIQRLSEGGLLIGLCGGGVVSLLMGREKDSCLIVTVGQPNPGRLRGYRCGTSRIAPLCHLWINPDKELGVIYLEYPHINNHSSAVGGLYTSISTQHCDVTRHSLIDWNPADDQTLNCNLMRNTRCALRLSLVVWP